MEEQYLAAIPVPVHCMEIDYNSAAEPDREFADSRLCTGEISDATTLEKTDRCSSSEWEKIWMYVFDTQEKTDPRNTNRFLLSHGKLRSFWVSGKEWTFSCTVCVDPPWVDSEDLVEISRGKSWKRKGPANGPTQSNICLSTAMYRRWSSVHFRRQERLLCADISKLSTQTGTPRENVGFLTLRGILWGGLVRPWGVRKSPGRDTTWHISYIHNGAQELVLYGLKC